MKPLKCIALLFVTALAAQQTSAAVPEEEAAKLGSAGLTWFGADAGPNADGSIPAYTGGLSKPPAGPKGADPYAAEKPLFSITSKNMAQYANRLSEGQKALLTKYPDYRLDIYPTHRDFAATKFVQENTLKNARHCVLVDGGNGLDSKSCLGGVPFPLPKSGAEVVWNLVMRVSPVATRARTTGYMMDASGRAVQVSDTTATVQRPFYDETKPSAGSVYFKVLVNTQGPTRSAGEKLLQWAHVNPTENPTQVWQYLPGQRRVRQAPELAFDTPTPQTGGLISMDENEVFQGSLERYDWKLVGKREAYVLNNNYALQDKQRCNGAKIMTPGFLNPDCLRWELQRVWVVEATLKPGKRHILPRRTLYIGEDGYQSAMSDDYDATGKLYRWVMRPVVMAPEVPAPIGTTFMMVDFIRGAYLLFAHPGDEHSGFSAVPPLPDRDFSPDALAAGGVR